MSESEILDRCFFLVPLNLCSLIGILIAEIVFRLQAYPIRKVSHVHAGFDHSSRHSTMIFTVNSMTTLMDNVERASARAYICMCSFFRGMDIHTRVLNSRVCGRRQRQESGPEGSS